MIAYSRARSGRPPTGETRQPRPTHEGRDTTATTHHNNHLWR
jgi:hypothetical protein